MQSEQEEEGAFQWEKKELLLKMLCLELLFTDAVF
jgi:hypothetical protein